MESLSRKDCAALDAQDRLATLRSFFDLDEADARGFVYLDGNSLGAAPRSAAGRLRDVVVKEWSVDLIRSWNTAGWITMAQRIGDKIAPLIGAGAGEVIVADSTSVNLYKVLSAALRFSAIDAPLRKVVLAERQDFPTDLYIADTLARERGFDLVLVDEGEIESRVDERTAVVLLTHVNYRTGRIYDAESINRAAHQAEALTIWDLSHTAGAMPFNVNAAAPSGSAADFAVGCGYKYLNGGPGAPAYTWVRADHLARMDREKARQPLSGWLGHVAPFEFSPDYRPANGIARFICGTPPILSLAALECGIDVFTAAAELGGVAKLREKSIALTRLFIDLVEARCEAHGLVLASPKDDSMRGSQVSFKREAGAYAIVQALIARGVVGDFRGPDILRFGFAPLYTRFVDVWDAVDRLQTVLETEEWRDAKFAARAAVT